MESRSRGAMGRVSGLLSQDSLYEMDDDDVMQRIRSLTELKESLQDRLRTQALEVDAWLQVLGCESCGELQDLSLESSVLRQEKTKERRALLREHRVLSERLLASFFLDGVKARRTDDGGLLVRFVQFPQETKEESSSSDVLMILDEGDDGRYSLRHHNLPDAVPVARLEREYLRAVPGKDDPTEQLKKFVTATTQYTRALYSRQEQIFTLEKAELLTKTHVYHNSGCTFITFLLEVKENQESNGSTFEFSLTYHPLDILPHKVRVDHIDGDVPSSNMAETMEEMVLEMKSDPFPQVIYSMLGTNSAERGASQESTDSTSSVDTIIF